MKIRLNKTDNPKIKLLHVELNFPKLSPNEFTGKLYAPSYGIFQRYLVKNDFITLMNYCIGYCYANELTQSKNYPNGALSLLFNDPLIKNSKCWFHCYKTIQITEKPIINYKKPLISKMEAKYEKNQNIYTKTKQ